MLLELMLLFLGFLAPACFAMVEQPIFKSDSAYCRGKCSTYGHFLFKYFLTPQFIKTLF
jgi:hypothetical protein